MYTHACRGGRWVHVQTEDCIPKMGTKPETITPSSLGEIEQKAQERGNGIGEALGVVKTDQGLYPSWKVREAFSKAVTSHMGPERRAGICQMHCLPVPSLPLPFNILFKFKVGRFLLLLNKFQVSLFGTGRQCSGPRCGIKFSLTTS